MNYQPRPDIPEITLGYVYENGPRPDWAIENVENALHCVSSLIASKSGVTFGDPGEYDSKYRMGIMSILGACIGQLEWAREQASKQRMAEEMEHQMSAGNAHCDPAVIKAALSEMFINGFGAGHTPQ
jgi:hypothetical protein